MFTCRSPLPAPRAGRSASRSTTTRRVTVPPGATVASARATPYSGPCHTSTCTPPAGGASSAAPPVWEDPHSKPPPPPAHAPPPRGPPAAPPPPPPPPPPPHHTP